MAPMTPVAHLYLSPHHLFPANKRNDGWYCARGLGWTRIVVDGTLLCLHEVSDGCNQDAALISYDITKEDLEFWLPLVL